MAERQQRAAENKWIKVSSRRANFSFVGYGEVTVYETAAGKLLEKPPAEAIAVTVADDVSGNDPPEEIVMPFDHGIGVLPSVV